MDTGCGEHSNIQVVRRRKFQEDENDRRDWLLWVTDPLGSALQILWRNWSTPIPLGAATARGKFCEKPQKVLGSFEVCAADLMQELEHTYPLVGKRVRQLRKGSSARNGRKSSDPLRSALQIFCWNWSTPKPLGREARAATAGEKFCEKSQKVLGSFDVAHQIFMKELEHPYPLVEKCVRQLEEGSWNRRKSADPVRSALQIFWRN